MQKAKSSLKAKPFLPRRVLVMDVGGTSVKLWLAGPEERNLKFKSGTEITPQEVVAQTKQLTADWRYEAITIGVPAPVKDNKITQNPNNLGAGWLAFDFQTQFAQPTRVINDAALQALAAEEPGRVLFLGLGTGLGSAMLIDSKEVPLELSALQINAKQNLEDILGKRGLKRLGKARWEKAVHLYVAALRKAFIADMVVIGGGNAKKLKDIPSGCRMGDNSDVIKGGLRLWQVSG